MLFYVLLLSINYELYLSIRKKRGERGLSKKRLSPVLAANPLKSFGRVVCLISLLLDVGSEQLSSINNRLFMRPFHGMGSMNTRPDQSGADVIASAQGGGSI